MSRAWKAGSTRAWRKLRLTVLARDRYVCRLQLPDVCTRTATEVHHVHGIQATGLVCAPEYLVSACRPCNIKIGNPVTRNPAPTPRTKW